jgi:hypothetical protein
MVGTDVQETDMIGISYLSWHSFMIKHASEIPFMKRRST